MPEVPYPFIKRSSVNESLHFLDARKLMATAQAVRVLQKSKGFSGSLVKEGHCLKASTLENGQRSSYEDDMNKGLLAYQEANPDLLILFRLPFFEEGLYRLHPVFAFYVLDQLELNDAECSYIIEALEKIMLAQKELKDYRWLAFFTILAASKTLSKVFKNNISLAAFGIDLKDLSSIKAIHACAHHVPSVISLRIAGFLSQHAQGQLRKKSEEILQVAQKAFHVHPPLQVEIDVSLDTEDQSIHEAAELVYGQYPIPTEENELLSLGEFIDTKKLKAIEEESAFSLSELNAEGEGMLSRPPFEKKT